VPKKSLVAQPALATSGAAGPACVMTVSSFVALGSVLVAVASLALTAFLALLNRRAQIADREAQSVEAHHVRLWGHKVPAILDYLVWLEAHADDVTAVARYPAPDDALYVKVTTFGPENVADLIARARVAVAQLRVAQEQHAVGETEERAVWEAAQATDLELSALRGLLRQDLITEPTKVQVRNRALLRALDGRRRSAGPPQA